MNLERVQAYDLPDAFAIEQVNLTRWSEIHQRALANSTNELVLGETKLFFATRAGSTQKFLDEMNTLSEKVVGTKFTDTQLGREVNYIKDNLVQFVIKRLAAMAGISITGKLAWKPATEAAEKIKLALSRPSTEASSDEASDSADEDAASQQKKPTPPPKIKR
jgi:hypothetical protein